eukprot:TRINITY_DN16246_c0_g1_i1.p1 TRINITY_DN16246_c0_g1~~TRINITY_DN16246_c0_g1_i1.p1  ORF type:complete len:653 (+),score=133.99 TRINITY_DN16246_c0_g1_i1:171-2129(+)
MQATPDGGYQGSSAPSAAGPAKPEAAATANFIAEGQEEAEALPRQNTTGGVSSASSPSEAAAPSAAAAVGVQDEESSPKRSSRNKQVPKELDCADSTNISGSLSVIPGLCVHAAGTLVGTFGLGVGYSFGKAGSKLAGSSIADSFLFRQSCKSFLLANGIWVKPMYEAQCTALQGGWGVAPLAEEVESEGGTDKAATKEYLRSTPVIVSNHVSYLDALVLPHVLRLPRMVAKSEVAEWPIFGKLCMDLDTIFVDRTDPCSRERTLQAIEDHVRNWRRGDRPLLLWPEGTTSNGRGLLDFRKGAFSTGAPVRPVLVKYTGSWDPSNTNFRDDKDSSWSAWASRVAGRPQQPRQTETGEPDVVPYSDSEWAVQFAGHMIHSCVVLVCRTYTPSPEEVADSELYAANVQKLMLERLEELHRVFEGETLWSWMHGPSAEERFVVARHGRRTEKMQKIMAEQRMLSRWDERLISAHIRLSEDGLRASWLSSKRKEQKRGLVFGDAPLRALSDGSKYYEVRLEEILEEETKDGLILGLTLELPEPWEKPALAVDMPAAWGVGLRGDGFAVHNPGLCEVPWRQCLLRPGDRAGLLVASDGQVWILENGLAKAKMPSSVQVPLDRPLYPFVELMGHAQAVTLLAEAQPPIDLKLQLPLQS